MINFDVLDGQTSQVVVREQVPQVVERVTATPIPSSTHLLQAEENWEWSQLRDYVITQIEKRHGPQPRDLKKEPTIFKSFLSRWPNGRAVRITKAAFEIYEGMWMNAPISVNRFCKGSDPYFAQVIIDRLER